MFDCFPQSFRGLHVFGKKQRDLSVPRQKEHNDMCLAIEKMKEKGRWEDRRKVLKAIEDWM
ncbi:MAG: hypothetical protein IKZ46_02515 [Victivallales bacterium]|nr:hypothetical protein [Victivallales bacterium]